MPENSRIVYVSGNNASGKSTLARELAKRLQFAHLPAQRFDTSYLDDLFLQQKRWSFEAQVHFLTFKLQLVRDAQERGEDAFIDRSPYEDAEIFARLFYETGRMDRRSYRTYQELYEITRQSLPAPDLILFCRCSATEVLRRVAGRGREYEQLYPKDHLRLLASLYDEWLAAITERYRGRVFEVDSEGINFTTDGLALDGIASEVSWFFSNHQMSLQLEGFARETVQEPPGTRLLRPPRRPRSNARRPKRKPTAYIAAPFTGKAPIDTEPRVPTSGRGELLWDATPLHGVLDPAHREFLESLEQMVKACGYDTFIPHRDINGWGEKELTPEEVARLCTAHVFSSDVIVALPAASFGTHYEVGVAMGYGMPIIVLIPQEQSTSFIMEGLGVHKSVVTLRYGTPSDLAAQLKTHLSDLASRSLAAQPAPPARDPQ